MNRRQKVRERCQGIWRPVKAWLINYGFAALVLLGIAGGAVIAWQVDPPSINDLPGLAFSSRLLYRNEVGAISFVFYYIAVLLFVMALNGRGMTQFGPRGVRDGEVVNRERQEEAQSTFEGQEESISALTRDLAGNIEVARQLGFMAEEQEQSISGLTRDLAGNAEATRLLVEEVAALKEENAELRRRLDDLEDQS